ncbi:hypothetical protein P43SY_004926 [Pythium insidiosum]|uniref:Uncharacterized protein n=1 Tax=Pythium insidiosum TaxID=114742 RepID=A0AAD5LUL7_PYTIN|nr:hypothetical protein P43SY_004926 [Pythium insidiosum]
MDSAATFKLISAVVIWALALLGAAFPLVVKDRIAPTVTSMLNMLAAGIFLAGSCLHLLPDAEENRTLATMGCLPSGKCLHLAHFFYALGFLVILLLEVFANAMQRRFGHALSHNDRMQSHIADEQTRLTAPSHHHTHNGYSAAVDLKEPAVNRPAPGCASSMPLSEERQKDLEMAHTHFEGIMDENPILAFVVFVALSFHSVMEGMGVGAAKGAAWDIFIAILAHKALAAFALSLELLHHSVARERLVMTIAVYSMMTPLGILLGSVFAGSAQEESAASGICSALAGGTFLFVAVSEIIPQELSRGTDLVGKCGALATGFVFMGLLSIWT